jgi:hypothetical protein
MKPGVGHRHEPSDKPRNPHVRFRNSAAKRPTARSEATTGLKSIPGPPGWVATLCGLATIMSFAALNYVLQPLRYCEFEGDTKCQSCPRHGTCVNNTLYCENHTVKRNGFCVLPGSSEDEAQILLPQIRAIPPKDRDPDELSKKLMKPRYLIDLAIEFANTDVLGGFNSWYSYFWGGVSLIMVIATSYLTYWRNRVETENLYVEDIVKYLDEKPPAVMTMEALCRSNQISVNEAAHKRILEVLSHVPHYDVNMELMTVIRRT